MPNHLGESTSPYLLQHAANPVDWFPWGEEAFAEARRRDVPVMVSVGYSSCHWCHVMAFESFSDPDAAEVVNANVVAVKVDREERPEVDAALMQVTLAMTGQGGWPNTVFLTPDGKPFFAGTYFPPVRRGGQPAFVELVEALGGAWRERRDEVVSSADAIVEHLRPIEKAPDTPRPIAGELIDAVGADYDIVHGGFGGPTKFPNATLLDALLVKGDPTSLDMAQNTCEHLVRGGIFDQVGGGFHRYSTDSQWVVPHFEKMLYDNALLLGTMARCWRRTADHDPDRRDLYSHAARRTVSWLNREMRLPNGLYAAGLDADSDDAAGHTREGIYYLWNQDLVTDVLGAEEAEWLRPLVHLEPFDENGLGTLQLRGRVEWERINADMDTLLEARDRRSAPARDEKAITAWNAMLVDGFVEAGMILREWSWVSQARDLAEALWTSHWHDGDLLRTSFHDRPGPSAVCEDYAWVGLSFASLAGATGKSVWLDRAVEALDQAVTRFGAPDGSFVDAEGLDLLTVTAHTLTDDASPSATAVMMMALRRVGLMAERDDFVSRAEEASAALLPVVASAPRFAGWALADFLIADEARRGLKPAGVVIADTQEEPTDLAVAAWRMAPAGSAIIRRVGEESGFGTWFEDRVPRDGQPTCWVCRGTVCLEPVTDYLELKEPLWRRV
ncbi:thioredoxin domain-containing protein [Cutibacterium sp. V970]|uniref:thioredoxin domain-containing protein n=1 Tax=Cutibacterium sp. V970 TaxID=3446481 RepID=UPI003EE1548C